MKKEMIKADFNIEKISAIKEMACKVMANIEDFTTKNTELAIKNAKLISDCYDAEITTLTENLTLESASEMEREKIRDRIKEITIERRMKMEDNDERFDKKEKDYYNYVLLLILMVAVSAGILKNNLLEDFFKKIRK